MISLLPFASVAECCPFRQPTEKTVSINHWNKPTLAGRLGEKRLRSSIFLLGQIRICHLRYRTKGHYYSIYTELTTWVAIRIQENYRELPDIPV